MPRISYKWNPTVCYLLCPASFTVFWAFVCVAVCVSDCVFIVCSPPDEALCEGRVVSRSPVSSAHSIVPAHSSPQWTFLKRNWMECAGRANPEVLLPWDVHKAGPIYRMPVAFLLPPAAPPFAQPFPVSRPSPLCPFLSFFPPSGFWFPNPAHLSFLLAFGSLCTLEPSPPRVHQSFSSFFRLLQDLPHFRSLYTGASS